MTPLEHRLALQEMARRKGTALTDTGLRERILASCFDKQRDFILDGAREKSALCPRRAGKTTLVPAYAYSKLLECPPGRIVRYWGITQDRAFQLMWQPLIRAADAYGLRIKPEKSALTIYLANGSEIRLVGADKAKEAEKKRGDATVLEIIDECSLYGPFLQLLAEEVIGPSVMDHLGTVCYLGTPGIVWDGFWFRLSGPAGEKAVPGVSRHSWDVYDNPFVPHAREEVERIRVKRNWPFDHPTYLREYRGRWVQDTEGLFYMYAPGRNDYDGTLPELPRGATWEYVLGWDLGFNDDMALVVWAFSEATPHLYEVHSWKKTKALTGAVAEEVRRIEKRFGHISRKVADTGGGGKLTVEEMAAREHLYFEAAKKTDKAEMVRFMNDDFAGGFIRVRAGSELAQEYVTLAKDPEDPTAEDPRCPNHCADAALYSYRRARHYQHEAPSEQPPKGTTEYFDNVQRELERQALQRLESEQAAEWWER